MSQKWYSEFTDMPPLVNGSDKACSWITYNCGFYTLRKKKVSGKNGEMLLSWELD